MQEEKMRYFHLSYLTNKDNVTRFHNVTFMSVGMFNYHKVAKTYGFDEIVVLSWQEMTKDDYIVFNLLPKMDDDKPDAE